jgi:hypothetical protein
MTGDRFFEGYDFDNWTKNLSGPEHAPVYWRPVVVITTNCNTMNCWESPRHNSLQVSVMPAEVFDQSELKNFPTSV